MSIKKGDSSPKGADKQEKEARYTLSQLTASKRYVGRGDLLEALLHEDKTYSFSEADAAINNFLKGKVD